MYIKTFGTIMITTKFKSVQDNVKNKVSRLSKISQRRNRIIKWINTQIHI